MLDQGPVGERGRSAVAPFQGPHTGDRRLEAFVEFHGPDGRGDISLALATQRAARRRTPRIGVGARGRHIRRRSVLAATLSLPIVFGLAIAAALVSLPAAPPTERAPLKESADVRPAL